MPTTADRSRPGHAADRSAVRQRGRRRSSSTFIRWPSPAGDAGLVVDWSTRESSRSIRCSCAAATARHGDADHAVTESDESLSSKRAERDRSGEAAPVRTSWADVRPSPTKTARTQRHRFRDGSRRRQVGYARSERLTMFRPSSDIADAMGCDVHGRQVCFVDLTPLPRAAPSSVGGGLSGRPEASSSSGLTSRRSPRWRLAVWYMDDGAVLVGDQGAQERTREGSGRSEICVQAMSAESREAPTVEHLAGA